VADADAVADVVSVGTGVVCNHLKIFFLCFSLNIVTAIWRMWCRCRMLRKVYLNHEMGTVVQFSFKDQTLMTCFSLYVGCYSFYCSWAIHRSTSVLVTRTIGCWTVPPVTVGCVVSYLFGGWYVWVWKFMFSWVGNWLTPFSLFGLHELSPWPNNLLSSYSPWFPGG
jgi:hypothetical protein